MPPHKKEFGTVQLWLRLTAPNADKLKAMAKAKYTNVAALLRLIVDRFITENETPLE